MILPSAAQTVMSRHLGRPASTPLLVWYTGDTLPCISSCAHDAAAELEWPGHTPKMGICPTKRRRGEHGNAGFFGRAGVGADNKVLGPEFGNFVQRYVVVAAHTDFLAELGEVLDDAVDERVAIIYK